MEKYIVVVEDEAILRMELELLLEKAGYNVIPFNRAEEAMDSIQGGLKYDLLLTDLGLPGRYDGGDIEKLSKKIHPAIHTISIHGRSDIPIGFDYNIPKPIPQIENLVKIIENHIKKD